METWVRHEDIDEEYEHTCTVNVPDGDTFTVDREFFLRILAEAGYAPEEA